MSVTATAPVASPGRNAVRAIRPPNLRLGDDTGLRIGRHSSAEAVRILLHCFFRRKEGAR